MAALFLIPAVILIVLLCVAWTTPGRIRRRRLRRAGVRICWNCHARLDEVDEETEFCPFCRARLNRFDSPSIPSADGAAIG